VYIGFAITLIAFDCLFGCFLHRQSNSRFFARTTGVITQSEVRDYSDVDGPISFAIRYTYVVDGSTYESRRYKYVVSSSDNRAEIVASHPIGSKVIVYFNPQDPTDAVLVPGLNVTDSSLLEIPALFNILIIAFWVVVWLKFRRS
jgi:hypothetical protein